MKMEKKSYYNKDIEEELVQEYQKTIRGLLIRLAKKEKEIKKLKEVLNNENIKEWKRSSM